MASDYGYVEMRYINDGERGRLWQIVTFFKKSVFLLIGSRETERKPFNWHFQTMRDVAKEKSTNQVFLQKNSGKKPNCEITCCFVTTTASPFL
jgi:hypothetical protein